MRSRPASRSVRALRAIFDAFSKGTFALNRAKDIPSMMAALKYVTAPHQNIVFADREGHIGFAREAPIGKRSVRTMECNTSPGSAGSQDNGDGCYKRTRSLSQIDAIYRLKEA